MPRRDVNIPGFNTLALGKKGHGIVSLMNISTQDFSFLSYLSTSTSSH